MKLIRDRAIVLRSVPFEDRHRIVTALSEGQGRISAMARNCVQSRRFGGALELFTASEWQLSSRSESAELFSLQEARALRSHEKLRADFERMAMASLLSELMLRVAPEREPCLDLFRLHANALGALEEIEASSPPIAFLNGYLAKILQWSGNQPRLQHCLGCGSSLTAMWQHPSAASMRLVILVEDAGWVCETCRRGSSAHVRGRREGQGIELLEVGASAMADFFMALVTPIRQVPEIAHASDAEHRELFRVLEALLIYHVPGFDRLPLNSLKYLGLESSWRPPADRPR